VRGRVVRVDRGTVEVSVPDAVFAVDGGRHTLLVGDWVDVTTDGSPAVLRVHPRATVVSRASADRSSSEQALAANVDVVVVVEPLEPAPSLGRIERLLALAWSSGATPLVVLTKHDLRTMTDEDVDAVRSAAPGVEVLPVSAHTGAGMAELVEHLGTGRSFVLLGPSGAGKSTLVNALAGDPHMATAAVRGDGRGRHTTTHRELVELASGSVLIDTPGLRAVGLVGDLDAIDDVFAEIGDLAEKCRFRDCAHQGEPDCAVASAVATGDLPQRRLDSWRKLQREAAYQARRSDARLDREERARMRSQGRSRRAIQSRP